MRALWLVLCACSSRSAAQDPNVELVGNPLGSWRDDADGAYARNIWDLQAFDGRLFIGYGDTVRNSGPTDVITFDPASREFTREHRVEEEAIHLFRVIGNRLLVPGVDAHGLRDGALFVRDGGVWTNRRLPSVVHATDVAAHGERLCVSIQEFPNTGAVACSRDDGATWTTFPTSGWRAVSLFTLGDALYVASHESGVRRVDADHTSAVAFGLPGVEEDVDTVITKPARCGDAVGFVAKRVLYDKRSAHVKVLGAFRASSALAVTRIESVGTPAEVFVDGAGCSVLANRALDDGRFEATITDLAGVSRAKFVVDAMARSVERMDGYYYVGLGCEFGECSASAGRIVRVLAPAAP